MEPHDILAALREATASRHAVLDRAMPLAAQEPTLHHYRAHLTLLRHWLAPIEAWQAGHADGPQDAAVLPPAPHLPLLDADLQHPALPGPGLDVAAPAAPWFAGDSAAYRWGVAYVIEGSRLGGTVLYRRLAARLAPHPLRYLHGDGTPPGPRWQHFLRMLREQVRSPQAIAAACAGARDAFDSLIALQARHAPMPRDAADQVHA
ncbi:biliverdin-producing heme oxygenase [Pseudoduganella chitinolytica]|uniref:Biliverdin-producing heme oxygenase n=1 Tax=Pseudoduganella chitinolytica TaxID=34070 RepID=A0ABY8BCN5_9BURK|nr:biliverdin-producing heme oxygenase [Pseudoduganella chitinolytica]WEF33662.1 biliverdin-producing heme oxygenase [Pseudoduganella chitinolytica]